MHIEEKCIKGKEDNMDYVYVKVFENHLQKYFEDKDIVSIYDLLNLIDNLDYEKEKLRLEMQEREEDIKENYRRIPVNEQYDVHNKDFI